MPGKNSGPDFIIKKCDTNSPYVFISYSSKNEQTVHEDVAEFQRRGYNVWVDCANVDLTKNSWRDDVYPAVASANCKKVLFYLSEDSLLSENCAKELEELKKAFDLIPESKKKKKEYPMFTVEAVKMKSFEELEERCRKKLEGLKKEELAKEEAAIEFIKNTFFSKGNERIRASKFVENGDIDKYYEKILRYFPDETVLDCYRLRFLIPFSYTGAYEDLYGSLAGNQATWKRRKDARLPSTRKGSYVHYDVFEYLMKDCFSEEDGKRSWGSVWDWMKEPNVADRKKALHLAYFPNTGHDASGRLLDIENAGLYLFRSHVGIFWYEIQLKGAIQKVEYDQDKIDEIKKNITKKLSDDLPEPSESYDYMLRMMNVCKDINSPNKNRGCIWKLGEKMEWAPQGEERQRFEERIKEPGYGERPGFILRDCTADRKSVFFKYYTFENFRLSRWIKEVLERNLQNGCRIRYYPERLVQSDPEWQSITGESYTAVAEKPLLFQYIVRNQASVSEMKETAWFMAHGYDRTHLYPNGEGVEFLRTSDNTCMYACREGGGYYCSMEGANKEFFRSNMPKNIESNYFFLFILAQYQRYSLDFYREALIKALMNHSEGSEEELRVLEKEIRYFLAACMPRAASHISTQNEFYTYTCRKIGVWDSAQELEKALTHLKERRNI